MDAVILAGDLTLSDEWNGGIIGPFLKEGHHVFIMSGNHDSQATIDFLTQLYGITSLEYGNHIHENVGIIGCGGANIGAFALAEDEMKRRLDASHEKIAHLEKKIMVTHVHPAGTIAETLTDIFPGSSGVRQAIEELQPDILICGHVHEAEGLEEQIGKTKVFNVGEKGKIIDV